MKFRKVSDNEFLVQLFPGEDIHETLNNFAGSHNLKAGILNGIGAIKDVKIGYYDLKNKTYIYKEFDNIFEVVSLSGNLSLVDGTPFFHIHVALASSDMSVIGGHLMNGKVAVVLEVYLKSFTEELSRADDDYTGLKIWKLR